MAAQMLGKITQEGQVVIDVDKTGKASLRSTFPLQTVALILADVLRSVLYQSQNPNIKPTAGLLLPKTTQMNS